jgi:hypothetical protein
MIVPRGPKAQQDIEIRDIIDGSEILEKVAAAPWQTARGLTASPPAVKWA